MPYPLVTVGQSTPPPPPPAPEKGVPPAQPPLGEAQGLLQAGPPQEEGQPEGSQPETSAQAPPAEGAGGCAEVGCWLVFYFGWVAPCHLVLASHCGVILKQVKVTWKWALPQDFLLVHLTLYSSPGLIRLMM